jgi:E3 ubiquitin-protein ligase Arkadia
MSVSMVNEGLRELEHLDLIRQNGHYGRLRQTSVRSRHARIIRTLGVQAQAGEWIRRINRIEWIRSVARHNFHSHGLSKAQIERYTIKNKYSYFAEESDNEKCAICLSLFQNNQQARKLACKHIFHAKCVDRWLKDNRKCPLCRKRIDE